MSTLNKILIVLGITVTLGLLSFVIYQQHQIAKQQTAIEKQVILQKDLADKIVRSQLEYATKNDLENFVKSSGLNLKTIEGDLKNLSADIVATNKLVVKSNAVVTDHVSSSSTVNNNNPALPICKDGSVCPNVDPFNYLTKQQNLKLNETFGKDQVPIGEVGFSSWQEKPWNINLLSRQYQVITVVGEDENQRQYYYNKFTIIIDGKSYDVKIDTSQTKQEYPTAKFSFFNPRLFLGIDGGLNLTTMRGEFGPSINLQLMSYGIFKNQPDWSILQLGIGYGSISKQLEFIVTPFAYNVGGSIPLMNNLYVGPALMLDTKSNIAVMGAITVGL